MSALLALIGAILSLGQLHAMSVNPPTFSELVRSSTQIVRAEVLAIEARYESSPSGDRPICTFVTCRVLRSLKGDNAGEITLRFLGGRVGDIELEVPGMPTFQQGARYVFFIAQNGSAFCPLVAVAHGNYPIASDGVTDRVLRSNGDPLRQIGDVARPFADHRQATGATGDAASALTLADFEAAILREIDHANAY